MCELLGYDSTAALTKARDVLGPDAAKYEYRDGDNDRAPVYFWAKEWVPLWSRRYRQNTKEANYYKKLREKWQARTARLNYLERKGQLLDAQQYEERKLIPLCLEIRERAESLSKVNAEAHQLMAEGIDEAMVKAGFAAVNGHGNSRAKS